MTLIELIVCTVIIGVLAGTALPLSRHLVRQEKEALLRDHLREMRGAIDRYYGERRRANPSLPDAECYPLKLDDLVTARCLRRIPRDPFAQQAVWGTRSTTDPVLPTYLRHEGELAVPPAPPPLSDGRNVFDVYSTASASALDGTPYYCW